MASKELQDLTDELFGNNDVFEPPKKRRKYDESNQNENRSNKRKKEAPAWHDPEDDDLEIDVNDRKNAHLRKNFYENEISATEYITRQRDQLRKISVLFCLSNSSKTLNYKL